MDILCTLHVTMSLVACYTCYQSQIHMQLTCNVCVCLHLTLGCSIWISSVARVRCALANVASRTLSMVTLSTDDNKIKYGSDGTDAATVFGTLDKP